MRTEFWSCLSVIAVGLAYFIAIGLLHRWTGNCDENGVAGPRVGVVLRGDLPGRAGRAGFDRGRGIQQSATHRRAATGQPGAVFDIVEFRCRCGRELAIRVPAVLSVHLRDSVAAAEGSPESKPLGKQGRESDKEQNVGEHADENSPEWARSRGFRLTLYSRSLGVVMGLIFVFSWLAQSIAGRSAFNEQQLSQLQDPVSWTGYVVSSDFWNRT